MKPCAPVTSNVALSGPELFSCSSLTMLRPPANPTNAVGELFILSLQGSLPRPRPESHQRSWWIVHTQPTRDPAPESLESNSCENPPGKGSRSFCPASKSGRRDSANSPTGRLGIFHSCLQHCS